MALSTQISNQPSNIPTDPFVPGRVVSPRGTGMIKDVATGEITYFGVPTSIQTQSQQSQQPKLPDPYTVIEDELQRGLESIENETTTILTQLTEKPDYKTLTLEKEFEVQDDLLRKKHLGPTPEGKTAQQQVDEYHIARDALIAQKQIAAIRLRDKVQPDIDKLNLAKEQAIMQLQEATKEKKIRLDLLQQLGNAGKLTPDVVLQQQYQEIGLDVPLSYFAVNPRQQLAELKTAILLLEDETDFMALARRGEVPGPEFAQKKQLLQELRKMHREEMIRLNPQFAAAARKVTLSSANQTLIGNKGGTIGTLVNNAKPLKKLDKTTAMTILQEAGGDKELARQIATNRGYEL